MNKPQNQLNKTQSNQPHLELKKFKSVKKYLWIEEKNSAQIYARKTADAKDCLWAWMLILYINCRFSTDLHPVHYWLTVQQVLSVLEQVTQQKKKLNQNARSLGRKSIQKLRIRKLQWLHEGSR